MQILTGRCNREIRTWTRGAAGVVAGLLLLPMPISAWLDHGGLPTSDKLTVIERFRRPNFGQLEIELTITDPTYYTKPWTVMTNARRLVGTELFEFICNENEKSRQHMGPHIK